MSIPQHLHQFCFLQEEQLDLVSLGSSVELEDSPLVFLDKVHLFRERVEELTTGRLPSLLHLSVTPRAAEYLQQHWASVTIGSLEEAPVPKVCCCARCGNVGVDAETEAERGRSDSRVQDAWCERWPASSVVLVGLLLLLAVLWVKPVGGASLCFSLVSWFSELALSLSSELFTSFWDMVEEACTVMEATVERWSTHLSVGGHLS